MDFVWKALLSEFLGTFFLMFIGLSASALTLAQGGSLLVSALSFGLVLAALIYLFGKFSGAHFNPAVSLGFAVAGQMNWGLMVVYWIAQILGAVSGAALAVYFFGSSNFGSVGSLTNYDAWRAVLLCALMTLLLVMTYLTTFRNPFLATLSGLIIGLVLAVAVMVSYPLNGGSVNPAGSLGSAIFSNNLGTWWIFLVGSLIGAILAALIYKLYNAKFNCTYKVDDCGKKVLDECGNAILECKKPVYDNCGNKVLDEDGKCKYEIFNKHERKLNHLQQTPLSVVGSTMSAHGFDPRYIKQEFDKVVSDKLPNSVVNSPQTVVKSALSGLNGSSNVISVRPLSTVAESVRPSLSPVL